MVCADTLHGIRVTEQFLRRDGRDRCYFGKPSEHCAIVQDELDDPLHMSRLYTQTPRGIQLAV